MNLVIEFLAQKYFFEKFSTETIFFFTIFLFRIIWREVREIRGPSIGRRWRSWWWCRQRKRRDRWTWPLGSSWSAEDVTVAASRPMIRAPAESCAASSGWRSDPSMPFRSPFQSAGPLALSVRHVPGPGQWKIQLLTSATSIASSCPCELRCVKSTNFTEKSIRKFLLSADNDLRATSSTGDLLLFNKLSANKSSNGQNMCYEGSRCRVQSQVVSFAESVTRESCDPVHSKDPALPFTRQESHEGTG